MTQPAATDRRLFFSQFRRSIAPSIRRAAVALVGALAFAGCSSSTDSSPITVTLSPTQASLRIGLSQSFMVSVQGTENTDVAWEASCGTVEGDGGTVTYTAPWYEGSCTLTATSQENASRSATATVTVTRTGLGQNNLLPNSGFDSDLSGWTVYSDGGTDPRGVWVAENAKGGSSSGSVEVSHLGAGNNGTRVALWVCLPSAPGTQYVYGATGRLRQALNGARPHILFWSFLDDACADSNPADPRFALAFPSSGVWAEAGDDYTAPDGTAYVGFLLGLEKDAGVNAEAWARFDDVFVYEEN